jgi:hypothetical protein
MAVNNKRVQELIDKAIAMHKGKHGSGSWAVVKELASALGEIIDERRGKCYNSDYAAADHYLNMRAYSALGGQIAFITAVPLILSYDLAKAASLGTKALVGIYFVPSTDGDPCPPTNPDIGVTLWAYRGLVHGMKDFSDRLGVLRPLFF